VGLAIGTDQLTAVIVTRRVWPPASERVVHRRRLRSEPNGGTWSELAEALTELRDRLPPDVTTVDVSMLPPLSRAKVLTLPPARRQTLRRLMKAEAPRHFLDSSEPLVADATRLTTGRTFAPVPCLAVCAPQDCVDAILAALRQAGLTPGFVTAGVPAILEAVRIFGPGNVDGARTISWYCGDRTISVRTVVGRPEAVFMGSRDVPSRPGPEPDGRRSIDEEDDFEALDLSGHRKSGGREDGQGDVPARGLLQHFGPDGLAACGALLLRDDGPSLLPDSEYRLWLRRLRRRAMLLTFAGFGMLLCGGWAGLAAERGQLQALRGERDALNPAVQRVRSQLGALRRSEALVADVGRVVSGTPRPLVVLEDLSEALPHSAYLASFQLHGSQGRITGWGLSPSTLLPRLARLPAADDFEIAQVGPEATGSDVQPFAFTFSADPGRTPQHRPTSNGP